MLATEVDVDVSDLMDSHGAQYAGGGMGLQELSGADRWEAERLRVEAQRRSVEEAEANLAAQRRKEEEDDAELL